MGFQLVPWWPALEQQLGKQVAGVMALGGGVDWNFGRKRGLGIRGAGLCSSRTSVGNAETETRPVNWLAGWGCSQTPSDQGNGVRQLLTDGSSTLPTLSRHAVPRVCSQDQTQVSASIDGALARFHPAG
jgi:hypothetical protein